MNLIIRYKSDGRDEIWWLGKYPLAIVNQCAFVLKSFKRVTEVKVEDLDGKSVLPIHRLGVL